jgi:Protein of unknown function (DUF4238)
MSDDLIFPELMRRCPDLDRVVAYKLSRTWSAALDRIITRMFDICEREDGLTLHVDHRAEAAFELGRLLLFLGKSILDAKAKVKPLDQYDPDAEEALIQTEDEQNKINNTARNMADGVWKPLTAKWRAKRPLIERADAPGRAHQLRKPAKPPPYRKHMHYVPQSTTQQWAHERSSKFLVYAIGVDGEVRARPRTPKSWGAATSLYSQRLEHLLGLIEGDARRPYQKLVDVIPLSELERRQWVAFLIAQHVRTPRFIRRNIHHLKGWIERKAFPYPTSPAHLGRAFETLFTNNDLYRAYYQLITGRAWEVVRAADGLTFLKGDNPAVITGRKADWTWRLIYPLTPTRCFIAGPAPEREPGRIIPGQRQLSDAETLALNASTCSFAESTVIGVSVADRVDPKLTIKRYLSKRIAPDAGELPHWGLDHPLSGAKN